MKEKPELRIEDGHDLRRHVLSCSHLDPADATIMMLAAQFTSIYQKRKANKKNGHCHILNAAIRKKTFYSNTILYNSVHIHTIAIACVVRDHQQLTSSKRHEGVHGSHLVHGALREARLYVVHGRGVGAAGPHVVHGSLGAARLHVADLVTQLLSWDLRGLNSHVCHHTLHFALNI